MVISKIIVSEKTEAQSEVNKVSIFRYCLSFFDKTLVEGRQMM